ncbi:MAG TPA: ATP-binding protein [Candidatus Aenigmarchaeota archaeon]|nr:ATP-binding protein [Candidatus Aenigmarchaeota archaeon]
MEEYGTVISTFDSPSTQKFSFVIKKGKIVRRGQYVQLLTEDGKMIARVCDVFKMNRYFMRPDSVEKYEASGAALDEIFPVDNWEYLVAEAKPLGIFSNESKNFVDVTFPPSPGCKVSEPEHEILEMLFGFDPKGLHIGKMPYHEVDVRLNMTKLLQKHLAILAISGAGKSYLTSVIVEELLKRKEEDGQISILLIDTHGEYVSLANEPRFSEKVKVYHGDEIQIGLPNLSHRQLSEFLPNLSPAQIRELARVIRGMESKEYSIVDVIEKIETDERMKATTKDVLTSMLYNLGELQLFGERDIPSLKELVKQGMLTIFDLSPIINTKKKQMIVSYFAQKMFNARRNNAIPPFLLILEEAHQFAPEKAKTENALSKGIIQTIAREGRKFHAALCLISQRPIQLSTTALSQCNTHIIMRVTNPYDLKHIGESSEGITRDVLDQISTLRVGNALIVGEAVNLPVFVKVRERESKLLGKGIPLEQAAIEYKREAEKMEKDVEAFI